MSTASSTKAQVQILSAVVSDRETIVWLFSGGLGSGPPLHSHHKVGLLTLACSAERMHFGMLRHAGLGVLRIAHLKPESDAWFYL